MLGDLEDLLLRVIEKRLDIFFLMKPEFADMI